MKRLALILCLLSFPCMAAQEIAPSDVNQMFKALSRTTPKLLDRVSTALIFDTWRFTSTTDGKKYWAIRYTSGGSRYCFVFDEAQPIVKPVTHIGYWNFIPYQTNVSYADEAMVNWCIR